MHHQKILLESHVGKIKREKQNQPKNTTLKQNPIRKNIAISVKIELRKIILLSTKKTKFQRSRCYGLVFPEKPECAGELGL